MALGDRLRSAREEKGWTQTYVSKILGITNQALSNYERGERDPDTDLLNRLATMYSVSTDWLLGRTDSRTVKQYDKIDIWNQDNPPTDVEFEKFLKSSNVYFSGAPLTDEDKEDIIAYLRFKWEREREKREKEKGR